MRRGEARRPRRWTRGPMPWRRAAHALVKGREVERGEARCASGSSRGRPPTGEGERDNWLRKEGKIGWGALLGLSPFRHLSFRYTHTHTRTHTHTHVHIIHISSCTHRCTHEHTQRFSLGSCLPSFFHPLLSFSLTAQTGLYCSNTLLPSAGKTAVQRRREERR